ncbi:RICIN domain-containing protein [Actinoplanes sp. NPDC051470]|uniref:RICIN domain-containing protein n=1 Tax=Actinoplanes sp. NPDC051470 TaxID=3157224 RepID=UPI003428CB71
MNRHIRRALAALAATAAIIGTTATPGAAAYPYYKVVNRHSNQCLEIAGGSSESGWWAQQWPCFGGEHQIWRIPLFTPVRQIVVRHTGFCLTALGGYAFQMPCNGTVNQNWG